MGNRVELSMEDAENVIGGTLTVALIDGKWGVIRKDIHGKVLAMFDIIGDKDEVWSRIRRDYWDYPDGQQDKMMLTALIRDGLIKQY